MNNLRRKICQSFGALMSVSGLSACAQPAAPRPQRTYSEEEQRRMHKFRGVNGYELYVSGFGRSSEEGVFARIKNAMGSPMDSGYFWAGGDSKSAGSLATPESLKAVQVEVAERLGGKELYKSSIPVADRIPDDLLDDLRQRGGNLRIKIRLHLEGVLLGWDIERQPNPWGLTREERQKNRFLSPAYSHTGGDFKEARPAYYAWEGEHLGGWDTPVPEWRKGSPIEAAWRWQGFIKMPVGSYLREPLPKEWTAKGLYVERGSGPGSYKRIWEKGWYIHPKTGQRIETDF